MKQQVNARISEATRAKMDNLTTTYGTQAEVIAVAIDRLFQSHQSTLSTRLNPASPAIAETYLAAMQPAADPANTYRGIAPEIELSVYASSEAEAMQALRAELIRQIEQDPDWIVFTGWPAHPD